LLLTTEFEVSDRLVGGGGGGLCSQRRPPEVGMQEDAGGVENSPWPNSCQRLQRFNGNGGGIGLATGHDRLPRFVYGTPGGLHHQRPGQRMGESRRHVAGEAVDTGQVS
jgi:hypothetical protein